MFEQSYSIKLLINLLGDVDPVNPTVAFHAFLPTCPCHSGQYYFLCALYSKVAQNSKHLFSEVVIQFSMLLMEFFREDHGKGKPHLLWGQWLILRGTQSEGKGRIHEALRNKRKENIHLHNFPIVLKNKNKPKFGMVRSCPMDERQHALAFTGARRHGFPSTLQELCLPSLHLFWGSTVNLTNILFFP